METEEPIGDGHPALKDPAFRLRAPASRSTASCIVERAYQGAGDPGDTIIPPLYSDYHWSPPEEDASTFDLDKADQLLDEAGYTLGDDGKRTMPDGQRLGTLRLFARQREHEPRRRSWTSSRSGSASSASTPRPP